MRKIPLPRPNAAPQNLGTIANVACGRLENLEPLAEQVTYMKGVLQVACKKLHRFVVDQVPVISPYQGGIQEHVAKEEHVEKKVKVAVFNPGRTGFLTLCTQEVMIWRLIIITDFLSKEGIDICFLPASRCRNSTRCSVQMDRHSIKSLGFYWRPSVQRYCRKYSAC